MLRTHYLFDPAGNDVLVRASTFSMPWLRRVFGVVLIIPRSQCVYVRLNAQGVPAFRLKDYARLQLSTMSPFRVPGYFLLRVGAVLHAWMWDSAVVAEFAGRHGMGEDAPIFTVPSSVCVPKPSEPAVFWQREFESGVEAQFWSRGRMLHSGWFDAMPSAPEWEAWRSEINHRESVDWPAALPVTRVLARPAPALAAPFLQARARRLPNLSPLVPIVLSTLTIALAGYAAWLWVRIDREQQAIVQAQTTRSANAGLLDSQQQARLHALRVQQEIRSLDRIAPRPAASEVLRNVAETVYGQGLVIRELEYESATVRVTVLPGQGELRMSSLIQAVEANPMFEGAHFVDGAAQGGMRFAWNVRVKNS